MKICIGLRMHGSNSRTFDELWKVTGGILNFREFIEFVYFRSGKRNFRSQIENSTKESGKITFRWINWICVHIFCINLSILGNLLLSMPINPKFGLKELIDLILALQIDSEHGNKSCLDPGSKTRSRLIFTLPEQSPKLLALAETTLPNSPLPRVSSKIRSLLGNSNFLSICYEGWSNQ